MSELCAAAAAARRGWTREELANNERTLNFRPPWMQCALLDTNAPGVETFGITSTLDRRGEWAAVHVRGSWLDRDAILRAGLRRKAAWLLRFTWRANGTSARIAAGLRMAMAESEAFLAKRERMIVARAA